MTGISLRFLILMTDYERMVIYCLSKVKEDYFLDKKRAAKRPPF